METDRNVAQFWNWLPHFRAVAETEHLPTAAKHAHLTPAALSRTVRLLEEAVGRPLFHRRGRRLHLNEDGRTLLVASRLAMQLVREAAAGLGGGARKGPVRIAAGGVGQVFTLRAVLLAHHQYPKMRPCLLTPDRDLVREQLLRGDLDLVVGSFPIEDDGLTTERLGYATSAVYCGPSHPLYGRRGVELKEVMSHPFVAPPGGFDGWPHEFERRIHFTADRMAAGMEICGSTALLAVIPDAFAHTSPIPLHRLDLPGHIPGTPVLATRRTPTGSQNLTEHIILLLQQVCEGLERERTDLSG